MPFEPLSGEFDLVGVEARVGRRWRDDDVFAESLRRREGAPEWVFFEGPPTANGRPGLHHAWARVFKDLYPRFHTMRGRYVARKGGWDCHGLPVEVEVEKELGFSGKQQIEEFGIEAFNRRCRESVQRYVEDWSVFTERLGMWLETADAYWTLSNEYIESVWWLFRQLWDRDVIYEGFKVVPYCGRCGTALSSHELAQPGAYQDLTDPSVYVRFPVVDRDFDLLVWTTTPWTLVSNVAAAVGPDIEYVRVAGSTGERDLVLAAERVTAVLGDDARVVGPVAVDELVGLHYERPFELLPIAHDANRIVAADFVTVDDGSGIVHLAPAFGEIDREVSEAEGLPVLNPVGPDARFDQSVPPYAGTFVKDADPALIEALRASGRLVRVVDYTHAYPHCWRCGTPLIYWAKPTWFAQTSAHKADLLRENETVGWHPEHIKHGRFGDWLENNVDWALSRDRFWGTPLPVWRCAGCRRDQCVGSVAELAERAGRDLSDLDLHRPYVDEIELPCDRDGCDGRARRVEPVLDAWFDSGSMPAAQFHYPFENEQRFDARYPADFICEAIDQTRGWFYSLLAVNTLVFGHTPYRNVVCLAHIVDGDGLKMSKSRGNVMDAWAIFDRQGADALRWYFFSSGSPWTPRRVATENIDESTRHFLVTLWNTASFFVTYANADGWVPPRRSGTEPARRSGTEPARRSGTEPGSAATLDAPTHPLDRWARSRLHGTIAEVTDALEGFDALRAAQALERLVDDLSNWYVRRSRARFWNADDDAAHATLHECLETVARLLAPFCPFLADELHRIVGPATESVHLGDWPEADPTAIDPALEADMDVARQLVSLGLSARMEAKIRVRQPLRRALVLPPPGTVLRAELVDEIADALNVKRVEVITDLEGLLRYTVVPNFRTLGPKLGSLVNAVKAALAEVDGSDVRRALDVDGRYVLVVDGQDVELVSEDVEVRASSHDELVLAQEGAAAVALDTALDDDLRLEGSARELVRALNDLRKAAGLAVTDRIRLTLWAAPPLDEAFRRHEKWIAGEVLAIEWELLENEPPPEVEGFTRLEIDGIPVAVRIERIEPA